MFCKKLLAGIALASLSIVANAAVINITENFDNGSYDVNNFVHNQPTQNNSALSFNGGQMAISNRGAFTTVRDDLFGTETNPLLISAQLTFLGSDIGFVGFRGDGQPNSFYNNEPNQGILLRIHNFGTGQTDVMYNATGNAASGLEYEFTNNYPPGGRFFFNNPVQVDIEDFGSYANFSLTNTSTNQNFSFTQTGLENSTVGGHVTFASNNVSFDNISIQQGSEATAVSEPAMASILALGLGGLFMGRRKRKQNA